MDKTEYTLRTDINEYMNKMGYSNPSMKRKCVLVVNESSGYDEYWNIIYACPIKFGFEI